MSEGTITRPVSSTEALMAGSLPLGASIQADVAGRRGGFVSPLILVCEVDVAGRAVSEAVLLQLDDAVAIRAAPDVLQDVLLAAADPGYLDVAGDAVAGPDRAVGFVHLNVALGEGHRHVVEVVDVDRESHARGDFRLPDSILVVLKEDPLP